MLQVGTLKQPMQWLKIMNCLLLMYLLIQFVKDSKLCQFGPRFLVNMVFLLLLHIELSYGITNPQTKHMYTL